MPFIVQRRVGGDQQVKEHQGKSLRLGRGTNVDIRFDDPGIDYEHAVIEDTPFGFVLRDLGGHSGTWVNGERVERAELQEGDRIDLGSYELNVRISGFGDYLFLYLEIEELGADDATSLSGLHSMTMSFASRELQDLARQARARHEAEQRKGAEAPTGPMKTVESSPGDGAGVGQGVGMGVASADRPESEVSASHILNLFSESGLDLREGFADFDQSLQESIAQTRQIRTVKAGPETEPSEAGPSETDSRDEPAAPAPLPQADLPAADGWSTSPLDDPSEEEPSATESETADVEATAAAPPPSEPTPTTARPRREEPAGIDYVRVYGLPGGLGVVWALALIVLIFGLGAAAMTAVRHTHLLSPGPLGGRHADAEKPDLCQLSYRLSWSEGTELRALS